MRYSLFISALLSVALSAGAEPYLAVRTSLDCSACHVNPTGGGQRNAFGTGYALSTLSGAKNDAAGEQLGALFNSVLRLGANARASAQSSEVDDREDNPRFELDRVSLYLSAKLNERVVFYLDQQVAPGGSLNREAWAQLTFGNWYLKAGRLFLPFGWRIEDDTAFVRQASGINFNNPDTGVELGFQSQGWNMQLSVTNGTAGAGEVDDGKQTSLRLEHLMKNWRLGISGNYNNTAQVDRGMYGIFVGVKTGKVSWLAEWDRIDEKGVGTVNQTLDALLLEANYQFMKAQNLKISLESLTSDRALDPDRYRASLIWEYFPWPFTQVRAGFRQFDSNGERALDNREEGFVQLHFFF